MLVSMAYFKPTKTFSQRIFCSSSISQPPGSSEVHLWCLCINEAAQSSLLQAYEGILSLQERTHVLQLKNEKVQKTYLLTRVLARTLLSRYTGGVVDPTSVQFIRSNSGKPHVVWPLNLKCGSIWHPPHLSFNISHTHSLIACAVTGGSAIGVDIEEKNRETKTDLLSFARRKFSTRECLVLEGLVEPQQRRHHFVQLWTLKEAYAKALGKGIGGTTLRDVTFKLEVSTPVCKLLKDIGLRVHEQPYCIHFEYPDSSPPQIYSGTWQLLLLELGDAHFASICLPTTGNIQG